jgi:hypothetical protein
VIGTDYTGSCKNQLPLDQDHNGPFFAFDDITEILVKVALNTITHQKQNDHYQTCCYLKKI